MTGSIILLLLFGIILFFLTNKISTRRIMKINALEAERQAAMNSYNSLLDHKRELKAELDEKERQIANMKNDKNGGIKTISVKDLDIETVDDNEKASRYLIQEGKLTLEQNEKVLQKMAIMQMDYIGTCLALGIIDIMTAKKAIKINKLSSKSASLRG